MRTATFCRLYKKPGGTYLRTVKRMCGCVCQKCRWEGHRLVQFGLDDKAFHFFDATVAIKGVTSTSAPCPKCGSARVVFTHVVGVG